MKIRLRLIAIIGVLVSMSACQQEEPVRYVTLTPLPTTAAVSDESIPAATCEDIERYWNNDWAALIEVLEALRAEGVSCGDQPLVNKQYAVHINYGMALEAAGAPSEAIDQYQQALSLDGTRREAIDALIRLDALPDPTPVPCEVSEVEPLPLAEPVDPAAFVQVSGNQLVWQGQTFVVRGVNYYSRFAQWHRFITDLDLDVAAQELDAIAGAGFNTVRMFLYYDPLFTCAPEDAVPVPDMFERVDRLLAMAAERGLKVIMTLNDLPDLIFRPLYTDYARYDAQTAYIVRRYRNDPTILAWDLRNEGDLDTGIRAVTVEFPHQTVIDWLSHISQIVRENDPNHLLTAGWWGDPTPTAPYVDILSFHHWESAEELSLRIAGYRASSSKPLMLQEVGYHSWPGAPVNASSPEQQAESLAAALTVAEDRRLSGWLVWTAFDYVPYDAQYNYEHFMGLWDVDLNPKPALGVVPVE
ncbi:MAG: cellulase family glycosylhydrolase [Anaerolineae bacterium]|nr:cellulase family glycosylhydrolase [Anaerolineae bacterium]